MKIFIDVGHGGTDPGACANGLMEKVINLTVAMRLKELLLSVGLEVMLSRETDIPLGLTERCQLANNWGADFFISVHHNAGGGEGFEVIHSVSCGKGLELAKEIAKQFEAIGQTCRRVYARESVNYPGHDYYTVIASSDAPAVITEYAFLDSEDYKDVDTTEELYREAEAIFKAICSYFNVESEAVIVIETLDQAIELLVSKGKIDQNYPWKTIAQGVKFLDAIFIKWANDCK